MNKINHYKKLTKPFYQIKLKKFLRFDYVIHKNIIKLAKKIVLQSINYKNCGYNLFYFSIVVIAFPGTSREVP